MRKTYPGRVRASNAAYYATHKEKAAALRRRWSEANAGKLAYIRRDHYRKNVGRYNAYRAARKAALIQAMPPWVDRVALAAIYANAVRLSEQTMTAHEVDHIIPLRHPLVCGLHVPWNLQILGWVENRAQGNRCV